MKQIYIMFYEHQTRKLHKDLCGELDLTLYPHILFEDPYYVLKPDILIGRLDHKKTFGFLRQELEDVYLEGRDLLDAMHDDIVLVKEGVAPRVIYVCKRALSLVVATVKETKKGLFFEPDTYIDRRLEVDGGEDLVFGHVVMLEVESIDQFAVYCKVKKIIGHLNDPDINTLKIVAAYDWPQTFSDDVMASVHDIKIDFEQEKKERLDLTHQLIITIDGKDAKDLDDAISLEVKDDHYILGVHIADVSHYVKEGTALDDEAYRRSTSSYLADRVIPMLPHKLSNDWCSLNPHEIKLTLSCIMTISKEGKVEGYDIQKSFIESKRRMTYDEVNQFLIHNKSLGDEKIEQMLIHMNELSQQLKVIRKKRGEIEFESSELGFIVDDKGRVLDVYERKTDEAEELIESFMLIANETVAFHMFHANLPSIYRIHEQPDNIKLKIALQTVAKLGFPVNLKQLGNPKPLQILTEHTAQTPYQYVVHMILLRAMQKAKYSEALSPHYGLGARFYTHFTSPIRRYPDLMLHRLIHRFVLGESKDYKKDVYHFESMMPDVAQHTSDQERKSIQMERDVSKLKSCEYMQDKIGQVYKATISQMMPSGMFVKLSNGIEGFVPLRVLDDYYMYDEANLTFVGNRGKRYRLGDTIKVELLDVDLAQKKMDFGIIDKKKNKKDYQHETYRSKQKGKA
ncbi:MAG: ribonuclease R [Tenericutes bacterium GWC2_34_14]|nr:MAG: ribonuclease R [Tenericutes bacterium GWA2_35_7]OHE28465.1 MAG: ribonuclease R [Tenericutes bacterium GWC2_34_14]OHE33627.1 MAG: ribonuclease R [Tenericutes bacterium GWE2_34_108]OHE36912.1 MAG: ribonuclease R [Tenericutes bacterium GWF1_35_14]OHE38008.1 MAG: ribonuclease R [Tenericutes bacterium GWF2_35_184]OHE43475.1 MAG: ribonuclease R [Tenericutes bacterium RIFOXYA2_FULL_36_32]OHE46607.1 MAG: ribonuclease R [Tenericutes bacterium RIFOXYB2_FULL_36_25]OHE48155.1 MAG: ribonuclease R